MSVYNEPLEWLKESVHSILCQTYDAIEFVIVIDNPQLNADVFDYLDGVQRQDGRVKIIVNDKNLGLAKSLNRGISLSKGDYIARMDADDISALDRLEKELRFLMESGADVVSTNGVYIDEASRVIGPIPEKPFDPSTELMFSNCILHPSVLAKKEAIVTCGCYREFRRSQDYDLWLRLLSLGKKIRILNEPLLMYRINRFGLSRTNRLEQYYTHLYQIKLFRRREKSGFDSFTESEFNEYIDKKRITKRKNDRCIKCMRYLAAAKNKRLEKKFFLLDLFMAFCLYPSIVIRSIYKTIARKKASFTRT